jgi:hypothetical protein
MHESFRPSSQIFMGLLVTTAESAWKIAREAQLVKSLSLGGGKNCGVGWLERVPDCGHGSF